MSDVLLEVNGLTKEIPGGKGYKKAPRRLIEDVSFTLERGEILGLVGESGSGKTTTARCINRLMDPTSGEVLLDGKRLPERRKIPTSVRRDMQMVFQDPYASLNPLMRAVDIVGEGIRVHEPGVGRKEMTRRVTELFELVGLRTDQLDLRPRNFSGGQRQRIGIARAIAVRPKLLLCDEPVASLDVSVQAQILNLFMTLRDELGVALLFIAHDLATVRHLCDRVAVMKDGRIVEIGTRDQVYGDPQAQYTRELLSAAHVPDPERQRAKDRERRALIGRPAT